jgi:8-oxo-dGTP diphosphatase
MYSYNHPRPSITVDVVLFTIAGEQLLVLLIKRANQPFQGLWALPGGFIKIEEDLGSAAKRELEEETGIRVSYLEQLHTYGHPLRDPRGRVISVVYFAIMPHVKPHGNSDATDAKWFPISRLPELAFDHTEIIADTLVRLRNKLESSAVVFRLLPETFDISQITGLYQIILGRPVDSDLLKEHLMEAGWVEMVTEIHRTNDNFSPRYRFTDSAIQAIESKRQHF